MNLRSWTYTLAEHVHDRSCDVPQLSSTLPVSPDCANLDPVQQAILDSSTASQRVVIALAKNTRETRTDEQPQSQISLCLWFFSSTPRSRTLLLALTVFARCDVVYPQGNFFSPVSTGVSPLLARHSPRCSLFVLIPRLT